MKNQYFGDVNDFHKYHLLRRLIDSGLSVTVAWMLTPDDGSSDGEKRAWMGDSRFYSDDSDLVKWFRAWAAESGVRDVRAIETSGLLRARFVSDVIPDDVVGRDLWFERLRAVAEGTDLVFFDPDNGIGPQSVRRGAKQSSKYVYWPELADTFRRGHSILLYQHRWRATFDVIEKTLRDGFTEMGAQHVVIRRGAGVAFALVAQERHTPQLERASFVFGDGVARESVPGGRGTESSAEVVEAAVRRRVAKTRGPRMVVCSLDGREISVGDALVLEPADRMRMRCSECGERVRAHRAGTTGQGAHFEHMRRNPECGRSGG